MEVSDDMQSLPLHTLFSLSSSSVAPVCWFLSEIGWQKQRQRDHEVSNYYYHKTDRSVVKLSGLLLQEAADTTANKTNSWN